LGALASYDRQELKKKVIDNASFRSLLELTPDIKDMIHDFYSSQYASCLQKLDKLKPVLLLDLHLSDHMEGLYQQIREKAMIQYFSPFLSVDLNAMSTAFNTSVAALEKELSKLIMENLIQARIDSHNKRLYARLTDPRTSTFQKSLQTGDEFLHQTSAALFRMSLLRHDFTVKPKRDREDRGAGGGDRMRDR
jgi:COP9 signalosome complex subunit 1